MDRYDEAKLYKDELQSESLLKEIQREQDSESSDGDSTVIEKIEWKNSFPEKKRLLGKRLIPPLLICSTILLASVAILLVWLIILQRSHHSDVTENHGHEEGTDQLQLNTGITSCGTTSASAIAAGCHFDIFSFGWTPPECTDAQLYNESIATLQNQTDGAFVFYTPNHDPIPLSALEDYGSGEKVPAAAVTDNHEIMATWEHYLVACAYSWQKVLRAAMREWPLEEWSAKYALAKQCGPDLLWRKKKSSESIEERLRPWFPMCGLEAEQMREELERALLD